MNYKMKIKVPLALGFGVTRGWGVISMPVPFPLIYEPIIYLL